MPLYEYECHNCGGVTEILHRLSETPIVKCCDCGSVRTYRIVSTCSFHMGQTEVGRHRIDTVMRDTELKEDLRTRYGVHDVAPLKGSRGSMRNIHRDVVAQGSRVREQMQATQELNAERTAKKQRDWTRDAMARRKVRIKEIKARQEKEKKVEFENRSISVSAKRKV